MDRWIRTVPAPKRTELLNECWAFINKGLNSEERYNLIWDIWDKRRIRNYWIQSSNDCARSHGFFQILKEIKETPGDIVECGIGRGVSLAAIVYAASSHQLKKRVVAFDSFAGFPAAKKADVGLRVEKEGDIPEGWTGTSPELIRCVFSNDRRLGDSLLRSHDIELRIVPGFFESTLNDNLPDEIAFLHVDCDLYDSTRQVLESALPRISPGGVVIFDEYKDERWPGATRAVDELCSRHGLSIEYFEVTRRFGVRVAA